LVQEHRKGHASVHEASRWATIKCVRVLCRGETGREGVFIDEELHPSHPVFETGTISPVSRMLGMPVRVHRLDPRPSLSIPRTANLDNQHTTYIMIEPVSGFAPRAWQQGIGTVVVARDDRQPLSAQALEAMWNYIDRLLDLYSIGPGTVTAQHLCPEAFNGFLRGEYPNLRI
jgi:hypothetical protein